MHTLNPSFKNHLYIGLLLSIWVFLFAFFIRPFEHGIITYKKWTYISIGFSLITFICYALIGLIQKIICQKRIKWNLNLEISILFLFYLIYSIVAYFFYKSSLINGIYDFPLFLSNIIFKSALIITPILVIIRKYSGKLILIKEKRDNFYLTLTDSKIDDIVKHLQNVMNEDKVFLNKKLTIQKLSRLLEINQRVLSQIINRHYKLSFREFINQYRVEEVKSKLTDKKYHHMSILGIALDCGFNSEASFYRIFKKNTGLSPKKFIQQSYIK